MQNEACQLLGIVSDYPRLPGLKFLPGTEAPGNTYRAHGSIGPGLHIYVRITDIHHLVDLDIRPFRHNLMDDCRIRFDMLSLTLSENFEELDIAEEMADKFLGSLLIFV